MQREAVNERCDEVGVQGLDGGGSALCCKGAGERGGGGEDGVGAEMIVGNGRLKGVGCGGQRGINGHERIGRVTDGEYRREGGYGYG